MARSRNIKPSFFMNEDIIELPFEARLLFIGLWILADREGRLENRPKKIKMSVKVVMTMPIVRIYQGVNIKSDQVMKRELRHESFSRKAVNTN
ncbi:hypothetical protein QM259_16735 [Acinetobacter baumannii]|uniref:hypothetical protein n=1 Tax=Acinetobacter baumannii TaxID=470 RepID=UPI0024B77AB9|nr:hypothetical protein [Acinetobacter baumannii]MDI9733891.1 hypothetical protein [Acinetobacter baumannii]